MNPSHSDRVKRSFRSGEPIDKALNQAALLAKRTLDKSTSSKTTLTSTAKRPHK